MGSTGEEDIKKQQPPYGVRTAREEDILDPVKFTRERLEFPLHELAGSDIDGRAARDYELYAAIR